MRNSVVLKREEGLVFIGTDDGRIVTSLEGHFAGDSPGDLMAYDISDGRWEVAEGERLEQLKALVERGDKARTYIVQCPNRRTARIVATWASDLRTWIVHHTLIW